MPTSHFGSGSFKDESVLSSRLRTQEARSSQRRHVADDDETDDSSRRTPRQSDSASLSSVRGLAPSTKLNSPISTISSHHHATDPEPEHPARPRQPPVMMLGGPPVSGHHHLETLISESTPLIGPDKSKHPLGPHIRSEVLILLQFALPIIGTHFLEFSLQFVTVGAVGHVGTTELAAASLAMMTANVTALSLIQGFAAALDTLCSQAYTTRPKETSLHAFRVFYLCILISLPITIFLWNVEPLFLLLRQDPRVIEKCVIYLRVLTTSFPAYAGFECIRRWLQAQELMHVPTLSLMFTAPTNFFLCWLFVYGPSWSNFGFVGAAVATSVSVWLMLGTCLLWSYLYAPRDAYGGLTWDVFTNVGSTVRLGIAATAMVGSEWWCWEIIGIMASYFGPASLAAQSVIVLIASCFFQIPNAIGVAASVRIGHQLGLGDATSAKAAAVASYIVCLLAAVTNASLLAYFRGAFSTLLSEEPEVVSLVYSIIPIVMIFQVSDGLSAISGGVYRGSGMALAGALTNVVGYYVLGLPAAIILAFLANDGVRGLWMGLSVALFSCGFFSIVYLSRVDWSRLAVSVSSKAKSSGFARPSEVAFADDITFTSDPAGPPPV